VRTAVRRRVLGLTAAGFAATALPDIARAQLATQPPPKSAKIDEFSVTRAGLDRRQRAADSLIRSRDRSHVRFGSLEYRSGLVLTSPFRGFGGLSGLRLDAKGERFIALSDHGSWFTGRIVYSGREMIGLADVEAAPMLGADGGRSRRAAGAIPNRSRSTVRWSMSGSSASTRCCASISARVSRDRAARWCRCRRRRRNCQTTRGWSAGHGAQGRGPCGHPDRDLRARPRSKRHLIAFLVGGPSPGQFSIRRTENYRCQRRGAAVGRSSDPGAKFSWLAGVGIRIRRIPLKSVAPGALVEGPSIFEADLGHEIDNMEGIDAHVTAKATRC